MTAYPFNKVTVDGDQLVIHGGHPGVRVGHDTDGGAEVVMGFEQARGLARFIDGAVDDTKANRDALRAKCMVMCRELGFTDADRHELSIMVVGAERSASWGQFTYGEIQRTADYLSGFIFVATILRDRTEVAGIRARAANTIKAGTPRSPTRPT